MTARPTGCARTSSSLAVSPKQAATLAHASGRCQWRWRHGQLAADAGVVARHTARHAWGYRMNTTTPPAVCRAPAPEEHTSELPSLIRSSYAALCLKKKKTQYQ